jgi:cytochrome c553
MSVYWTGPAPTQCDLCTTPITDTFIDGKTIMGPWANMCSTCHEDKGVGLGLGRGQLYGKQADGRWLKTKG